MIDKRSYILLILGVAGILSFFLLRPYIDFFAEGAISESKKTVEQRIHTLAPSLGFSADSMATVSMRRQHQNYFQQLVDSAEEVTPARLNRNGAHIQSWETVLGIPSHDESYLVSTDQAFESLGRLRLQTSNAGNIIRIFSHPQHPNPTFIQGDSLLAIAEYVAGNVLGYQLDDYQLNSSLNEKSAPLTDGNETLRTLEENDKLESLEITWTRKPGVSGTPKQLVLNLTPVVREIDNGQAFRTEFGFSVASFLAKDEYEPDNLIPSTVSIEDENLIFTYLFFGSLIILAGFVFSVGVRNIFRGKVEWRRALFMFLAILAGTFGWRALFFIDSFNPFLTNTGIFIANINNLLIAVIAGLYASLGYISWEALARSQHQKQLDIIDALWQRKFFVRETGSALIHGFAIGGIVIGIISSLVFVLDEVLLQADSQFGFAEPGISLKLLTINISAWSTTWLVAIGQIGFVYAILKHWLKKEWLAGLLSIIFSGIFITVIGRLIGTSGTVLQDMAIYMGIAVIFIYAMREYGLLSVTTGWWFFTVFYMMMPYWGSSSISLAYVGWVQTFIMAGPLIYGFIAYRYGVSVAEVGNYIPEYEERIAQHLRVEKEIEIARESQYKLMPLQPPAADGIDVYGFFMPSFEVGGDYFDYLLTEDESGSPSALTMSVVDVSGKAMRAAMPAVFTSGLLLSRMKHDCPDEVLTEISEPIYHRTDKRTFITCVLARYDMHTQKMAIANAGHCRPILKRNGIAEYIHTPKPSYPLGMKLGVKYEREVLSVKKGDFFLLYSDGLPEAVNEQGQRLGFDEVPRLIESIDTDTLSAKEIAQEIKRTVQKFSNYQLADDTTIICLKL